MWLWHAGYSWSYETLGIRDVFSARARIENFCSLVINITYKTCMNTNPMRRLKLASQWQRAICCPKREIGGQRRIWRFLPDGTIHILWKDKVLSWPSAVFGANRVGSLIEASTFVYFAIFFTEVFAKFWRIQHLAGGCKHHMSGYGDELLMWCALHIEKGNFQSKNVSSCTYLYSMVLVLYRKFLWVFKYLL